MDTRPNICSYCYNYRYPYDPGEIQCEFFSTNFNLDRNKNNNDMNSSILYNPYCENINDEDYELNEINNLLINQSYNSNSNLDNYSMFESIILENIDKLSPDKKSCRVCLENFEKFDKIINLSCLHMFHENCIRTWLKENQFCPICKNPI